MNLSYLTGVHGPRHGGGAGWWHNLSHECLRGRYKAPTLHFTRQALSTVHSWVTYLRVSGCSSVASKVGFSLVQ